MAIFGDNVKTAFLKGIEALGKTASTLAEGAQQKLSEINLETRRRELLAEIPVCVQKLYEQGVELPEELTTLLDEVAELDAKLQEMRPQPAVKEEAEAAETAEAEEAAAETSEETEDEAAEETAEEIAPPDETAVPAEAETEENE